MQGGDSYSVDEAARILQLTPDGFARCYAPASWRGCRPKRAAGRSRVGVRCSEAVGVHRGR